MTRIDPYTEAVEKYGPAPANPIEALAHVIAVWDGEPDSRMVLDATSNIYGRGVRTGLTLGDVRALGSLADFARWIVALDDVDGPGAEERRTVTLNRIIERARLALGETPA
jgi:hypothetical protein